MSKSVNDTANIFKALGDTTRLKIVKLIGIKGNNLCVGMVAHKLGISQPAVSQHLRILKNAGLVEAERRGFHMHYRVKNNILDDFEVDIIKLLKKIDINFEINENCELKDDNEKCNNLNK